MPKYAFLFALLLLSLTPNYARAEVSWWDVFFPTADNEALRTLKAPFADPDMVIDEPEEDSILSLKLPHMTNPDVAKWVERRVADLLIYNAADFNQVMDSKTRDFAPEISKEYIKFLQDSNILKSLASGAYDVRGFTKDIPYVVNEGAVNNRYRWLLRVPVMITFVKSGLKSYEKSEESSEITQEYIISLQIGRVRVPKDASLSKYLSYGQQQREILEDIGVSIEAWSAKPAESDKKTQ